ncbi:MAG: type II toxin-antitoxin system RelE/ParE family toxin [Terriglobia bacterium]
MTTTPYPYLVFYEVTESEIVIHAVRHSARDPSGMPSSA